MGDDEMMGENTEFVALVEQEARRLAGVRITALERENAAAREIVAAVANARLVSTERGWSLVWDDTSGAANVRDMARMILAELAEAQPPTD